MERGYGDGDSPHSTHTRVRMLSLSKMDKLPLRNAIRPSGLRARAETMILSITLWHA